MKRTDSKRQLGGRGTRARRAAMWVAEGLLILATIGLVAATLLPTLIGPSEEKQRRDTRSFWRVLR